MWGVVLGLAIAGGTAQADDRCMWGGTFYGPGAMSCQNGQQARCVDRAWKMTGEGCAGQAADPSGEENQPGVAEPRVAEPPVVQPKVE
jgi:hypothetical protein